MAGQFQMAHAKRVTGAAIIAGGPYGCSESIFANTIPGAGTALLNLSKAVNGCMLDMLGSWGVADPADLAQKAEQRAEKGEIDPIADVTRDRIYLFTGTSDHTVAPSIVKHAEEFYAKLGVPEANMKLVSTVPAGHAFVTDDEGNACEVSGQPYVVDCDYDQAGELLKQIYGPLQPRAQNATGDFVHFDQRPFGASEDNGGLAETGVVYIPKTCRETLRLPNSHCFPWVRAKSRDGRRRFHQGIGLCSLGRHKPSDRPFSTSRRLPDKSASMLGLVGLYRS